MTKTLSDDLLDTALSQFQAGRSVSQVLGKYPAYTEALGPFLEAAVALKELDPVETPTNMAMTDDRNNFLAGMTTLQPQPVSPGPLARLQGWILFNLPWLVPSLGGSRWEVRQMSILFLKATLVFTIIFGSLSGVIIAADNSLPGSPFYSIKLVREQAYLAMNDDPAEEAALHLNMAQERIQEMIRTSVKGDVPQEATISRLQTHMNSAFRYAAQIADEPMIALLLQAQEMSQRQEQALIQVQDQANEQAKTRLKEAAHQMSEWRLEAEEGLQELHQFRQRYGNNQPEESPGSGGPGGNPECEGECEPAGDQNRYGQESEDPQSGHSPGPGEPGGNPDCTGDCDQGGDGNQYGQDVDDPPPGPGPGEPGGNPDCFGDCNQGGDGSQYGQKVDDPPPGPGPGEPGGDSDCSGDCDQDGDGSQHGQDVEDPPPGPGPGEPEGNPDCSGDCDQTGDGSQHGQDVEDPPPGPGSGEPEGNPDCSGDCDQTGDGGQTGGGKSGG